MTDQDNDGGMRYWAEHGAAEEAQDDDSQDQSEQKDDA